jgi:IclR family acetate operon transcriptional repressor
MAPGQPGGATNVKSAIRTLDIIEHVVAQGRPLVANDIAAALAIPVSSLSYLLATLVERQYLKRDGRRYLPGPGLQRLQARASLPLAEQVAPIVRGLRRQLDETVSFFVRTGWEVEAIATETSEQALRYAVAKGSRAPLHAMAAGKALLATLSAEDFVNYLATCERRRFTPRTITDAAALRAQVDEIARTGIARTDEEYTPGIVGIARVVRGPDQAIGALAVAVPKVRYGSEADARVVKLLAKAAATLEGG